MAKKVYVVTSGCYSDYRIERVFSTKELADDFCDRYDNDYQVVEYELDGEMPPREEKVFSIWMQLDNKEVFSVSTRNIKERDYVHIGVTQNIYKIKYIEFCILSDSKERAIKVASERFGEVIAQEQFKFPYLRVGVIKGHYGDLKTPYYDFRTGEIVLRSGEEFVFELPAFIKTRKED